MNRATLHIIILLLLPALLPTGLKAQSERTKTDTSRREFFLIDHMGRLIEDSEGAIPIKWISGGMQLRIDSTYIYADSAVIFGEQKMYAYQDVVIQQGDSLKVFTDSLYYYRDRDVAELVGEVVLQQGTKQLWTNNLTYHLGRRFGEYHQGGILVDRDLQVSSRRGFYSARSEEIVFRDSVVVLHPKFNLAADSMRYLAGQSRVLFTGPTNIYTGSAKIYTEKGYYDLQQQIAEFNKNAQYASGNKKATADTIRYFSNLGEVYMGGHVEVFENNQRITGNSLRYLERTGETWIEGTPAIYRDSTRLIVSPKIFYNEKTNQFSTTGRSEIRDGSQIILADSSRNDEAKGVVTLAGNVHWRDTIQGIGIIGEKIDYKKETEYLLAYGSGRQIFYTIVEGDTLFIGADTLNMRLEIDTAMQDSVRMIYAYHDVRLFKSDMQGKADSLVFNGRDSLFTFYKEPVLWSDTTQFTADTIFLTLKDKKIDDVILQRRALIISEILHTYYDQIKGRRIVAAFDSSAIHEMTVTGNAESIYYTRDDNDAFIGVNKTICSHMLFTFDGGEIHFLKYYGDNQSSMLPMHEAQHDTLRLEGFHWRSDERPLSVDDLR